MTARSTLPRRTLLAALCLATAALSACAAPPKKKPVAVRDDAAPDLVTYGTRDDVMRFGAELAQRRGLDPAWVQQALSASRFVPSVAKFIMPPPAGTAKNWAAYRGRFVEPIRIRAGAAFWEQNERWLVKAQAMYGVPAEVIVGVVGVESIYGRQMGNFRVIDALATLSFDFPTGRKDRTPFFRDELEQFFVMCHSEGLDPLAPRGSYAGAMGMGQFMPSSWNRYAVDFDGDGHIDMNASAADVIGSVAHFLAESGWQTARPTHFPVRPPVETSDRAVLLGPDILPTFTAAQFTERGAVLDASAVDYDGKLALVELQNGDAAPSYVAGTENFYAVTRYNWSAYYALAVIELGEAVGRVHRAKP